MLLGLANLAGCGRSTASVTGKVTYQGAPLKGGNVTFHHAGTKQSKLAVIYEDGSYTIDKMPTGDVTIAVETESLRKKAQLPRYSAPGDAPGGFKSPDPAVAAQRYVAIPATYADPGTSGLTCKLKGGKQEHDIPLK
jgi:hypothetical protein